jgi:hypothetical protein
MRSVTDPRFNGLVHIVRELKGTHANDRFGIYYHQYDLKNELAVRRVQVEAEAATGTTSWRRPAIAFDPKERRLWCVYHEASGGAASGARPNGPVDGGDLYVKYSNDNGATWSSRIILSADENRAPSIAFGMDGTGWIIVGNKTDETFDAYSYSGATVWKFDSSIQTVLNTGLGGDRLTAVGVSHNGKAVAFLGHNIAAGSAIAKVFTHDGTNWSGGTNLETYTSGTDPGVEYAQVFYDLVNLEFQVLYFFDPAADLSIHRVTVDLGLTVGTLQDSGVSGGENSESDEWTSATQDSTGDIHVMYSDWGGSGDNIVKYHKWTRSTNSWDLTGQTLDWAGQIADHTAAQEPGSNTGAGTVAFDLNRVRVFFCAEKVTVPADGEIDEDLWTAEDPAAASVTEDDIFTNFGRIVGLSGYETVDTALSGNPPVRRLMAYIGDGIYHDNNANEFAGNILGTGAFEPVPQFQVFEGDVYIVDDGTSVIKKWNFNDATTTDVVNTTADPDIKPYILFEAKNRLWAVEKSDPRRVLFSGLRVPDKWKNTLATADEEDAGFIVMNGLPYGEAITAGAEFYGNRIIFSQTGIMEIAGDTPFLGVSADINIPPFVARVIHSTIGAAGKNGVVNIGSDLLFLSRKGIHSLLTTDKTKADKEESYISAPIQDLFKSLDKDSFERSNAVHYERKNLALWTVARDIDEKKTKSILAYNYAMRIWSLWTFDFEVASMHTRVNPDTQKEELLLGTDRGYVVIGDQDSRTNELGSVDHTATVQTMWLNGGAPRQYKKFTRFVVHLSRPSVGTVSGTYWVDNHDAVSFTIDQNPFNAAIIGNLPIAGDKTDSDAVKIGQSSTKAAPDHNQPVNLRGRNLRVELTGTAGGMYVAGLEVEYIPGPYRGDIR